MGYFSETRKMSQKTGDFRNHRSGISHDLALIIFTFYPHQYISKIYPPCQLEVSSHKSPMMVSKIR